jgi:hypothetical protein
MHRSLMSSGPFVSDTIGRWRLRAEQFRRTSHSSLQQGSAIFFEQVSADDGSGGERHIGFQSGSLPNVSIS